MIAPSDMTTEPTIAKESGHFYDRQGNPAYTIKHPDEYGLMKPNGTRAIRIFGTQEEAEKALKGRPADYWLEHRPGKEVTTNVTHARKYHLVPGQGRVSNVLAKEGLNHWQKQQILLAAATSPLKRSDMDAGEWAKKVKEEADRQAEEARQKGVEIHGAIERYAGGHDYYTGHLAYIHAVENAINHPLREFDAEKSAAHPWGYGCKTDLLNKERRFIADVKCKEFYVGEINEQATRPFKNKDAYEDWAMGSTASHHQPIKLHWPEHCRQIAANAHAHGLTSFWCQFESAKGINDASADQYNHPYTGINIYVSTSNPGQVYIHQWEEDELKHELQLFYYLLKVWQIDNKYDSSF